MNVTRSTWQGRQYAFSVVKQMTDRSGVCLTLLLYNNVVACLLVVLLQNNIINNIHSFNFFVCLVVSSSMPVSAEQVPLSR
jgi:hypothetical protein